jgi:hypothetical protein
MTEGTVKLTSGHQGMKNTNIYAGYRYPPQIISHAVWLYHRFTLSLCDIEELLAARGMTVSNETIRNWCQKFVQRYCKRLKKNRGRLGDTWYCVLGVQSEMDCSYEPRVYLKYINKAAAANLFVTLPGCADS